MKPLLSSTELEQRSNPVSLLDHETGKVDKQRLQTALEEATGIIAMHCPFLLDEATGELSAPLPPQFREGLRAICADIALFRLSDELRGSEEANRAYRESIRMLERINTQHGQTLATPAAQDAMILDAQGRALKAESKLDEFFGPPPTRRLW